MRPAELRRILLAGMVILLMCACGKTGGTQAGPAPEGSGTAEAVSPGPVPTEAVQEQKPEEPVEAVQEQQPEGGADFRQISEIRGTYEEPDPEAILGRLNEIRLEACREGLMNPSNGEILTEEDYVPLQWSADMERIAMTRAAEACVREDHVRPCGKEWFTVQSGGAASNFETLAWGYGGILSSIEGWYSEKAAYTGGTGEVASHYVALITPVNRYVGIADFMPDAEGEGAESLREACAAEFSMGAEPSAETADPKAAENGPAVESDTSLCGGYGPRVIVLETE